MVFFAVEIEKLIKAKMSNIVMETNLSDVKFLRRGKVRDVYEIDDYLLIIATDRSLHLMLFFRMEFRIRAGFLRISIYWFNRMKDIIENHIVATEVKDYPEVLHKYKDILEGRSMLVKKAKPMPVECIVRGISQAQGGRNTKIRHSLRDKTS